MRLKQSSRLELQELKGALVDSPERAWGLLYSNPGSNRLRGALGAIISKGNGDAEIEKGTLKFRGPPKLNTRFSPSTLKLLRASEIVFTETNSGKSKLEKRAMFPLSWYMEKCGYNAPGHNGQIYHLRKIRKDLEVLRVSCYTMRDVENFLNVNLVTATGIIKGNIVVEFSERYARYIKTQSQHTKRSLALLRVSEKSNNYTKIGEKIDYHYNLTANHLKGTEEALKVESLIGDTDIPSLEVVRRTRKAWREKMLLPFELALEELVKCGYLSTWSYATETGEAPGDVETWLKTTVRYSLVNPPDHSEDIKRLQERTEKQAQKTENETERRPRKTSKKVVS